MIVQIVYIRSVTIFKFENDTPVTGYGNIPKAFQQTFQGVQPKAGQIHIHWAGAGVQPCQYQSQPRGRTPDEVYYDLPHPFAETA